MSDLVERIRYHIAIRGGPAKDDDGKCIGTTWPMMLEAADEIEYLRTLLSNAVNEFPVASGLYVDQDGQAGYGSLKAMRLRLGLAPNRGFLHVVSGVGDSK